MSLLKQSAIAGALSLSLLTVAGVSTASAGPPASSALVTPHAQIVDARFVPHKKPVHHYIKHPYIHHRYVARHIVRRHIVRHAYIHHPLYHHYRYRHYYVRRGYGPGPAAALGLFGATLGAVIANSGPDYDDYGYGYGYPGYYAQPYGYGYGFGFGDDDDD